MDRTEVERSRYLQELLDERDPEMRGDWLRMRTAAQRVQVLSEWASDPRLMVTDIVSLPSPYNVLLEQFVVGNPRKNIVGTGAIFYLGPNEDWKPKTKWGAETCTALQQGVQLDNGFKRGKRGRIQRQLIPINVPQAFPADRAISAMYQYGPESENPMARNRLKEYTARQFADWRAGVAEKSLTADLNKERAKRDVAEARAAEAQDEMQLMKERLAKLEQSANPKKARR